MDTGDFYNAGLEEQMERTFVCPICHQSKSVPVKWNKTYGLTEPEDYRDILCKRCDEFMEKK